MSCILLKQLLLNSNEHIWDFLIDTKLVGVVPIASITVREVYQ